MDGNTVCRAYVEKAYENHAAESPARNHLTENNCKRTENKRTNMIRVLVLQDSPKKDRRSTAERVCEQMSFKFNQSINHQNITKYKQ